MRAGKLRHRVTFNRRGEGDDDYGNVTSEFAPLFSVWGNVRETTGKERVAAGAVENVRTATIRIRNSSQVSDITEADQVEARGEVWNIRGIAHADDTGVMLDLLVESGAAQ
ncbi:phage head closure protein [Roseovarius aestuarii]|nr:phage head closure protein [Roseovarius aestuarii]